MGVAARYGCGDAKRSGAMGDGVIWPSMFVRVQISGPRQSSPQLQKSPGTSNKYLWTACWYNRWYPRRWFAALV